jgi:hypothetical protein
MFGCGLSEIEWLTKMAQLSVTPDENQTAQPGARANGPERPWLILNVRQKQMVTPQSYTEISLGMCRTFRLQGSKLHVARTARGRTFSQEFDLAQVAPGSTRVKMMNRAALNRSITYLGVIVIIAAIARVMLPVSPLWVAIGAAVLSSPAARVILYFSREMDVEQFQDAHGKILFDFIHSKKQARQLEEFLVLLRAALEKKEPNQAPEPTAPSGRGSS